MNFHILRTHCLVCISGVSMSDLMLEVNVFFFIYRRETCIMCEN